ncbi:MAG: ChaN family lipoprotein [Desulfobacterales bacterium]
MFPGNLLRITLLPALRCAPVFILAAALLFASLTGCSPKKPQARFATWQDEKYPVGTILSSREKKPVTFEEMTKDLLQAGVVYVGESHTNEAHHEIQLKILLALHMFRPDLGVGMEMFSRPYQHVLDQWIQGELDEQEFIRKVHWYANWKHDYSLYRGLLDYVRQNRIPLRALNIAFHVPPKIAAGGLESLLAEDEARLPGQVDLSNSEHREYVRDVFQQHRFSRGERKFEHFYQAQCVWEDVMAESVSDYLDKGPIVVFAGKGHVANAYGIPDRAYSRSGVAFKTVLPVSAGTSVDFEEADYFWVTPQSESFPH